MFAGDYFAARDAFRRLAAGHTTPLLLTACGPEGEALSIDIVWVGAAAARRVVVVTSGLHGIEGFAGSAVQCALLASPPAVAADCALVLIHALNPWGFAHLRRSNEHNVDLNRNFLRSGERYAGAPELYRALDPFLNPATPPRRDGCYLRALVNAARYGMSACRQAIAEGQYEFDHGLFFGGRLLEQGPRLLLDWMRSACIGVECLLLLDLHSGLGPFAAQTVLAASDISPQRVAELSRLLQTPIAGGAQVDDPAGFAARGSLGGKSAELLPRARVESLTVEFGTFSGMRMLHALREENRWHHHGAATLDHASKRRLLHVFRPDSAAWRDAVLAAGPALIRSALAAIGED